MSPIKKYHRIFIAALTFVLTAAAAYAVDDGFGSAKKIESQHVVVHYADGTDVAGLEQKLNMRPSDAIMAGQQLSKDTSDEKNLVLMLDALLSQVSNILDMRINTLKVDIKVCHNDSQLKNIYNQMFNADLGARKSFYVYDTNTIYVSEEGFERGVIGHEMAHAIISHYFVIPAPVKIQEILAMYVEYNLRHAEK